MSLVTVLALYVAGLASFLSPCVLPLLPSYLAILAGAGTRRPPWPAGLGFAFGLSAVFVVLGFSASSVALSLSAHQQALQVVGGALMAMFGAKLLGLLPTSLLDRDARPFLARAPSIGGFWGGLLFGAAFSIGWTPCVGPVLGAALSYAASRASNPGQAALQLLVYALGLSTPLLVATLLAERALAAARLFRAWIAWSQRITGGALVALGLLMAVNRLQLLTSFTGIPQTPTSSSASSCSSANAHACAVAELTGVDDETADVPLGQPHLLEFVSENCTVCARMTPLLNDVERRCARGDGSIIRVSLESRHGQALAQRFGVHALPTFVQLDVDGQEVDRAIGEQTKEALAAALSSVRGEACRVL